MKCRQSTRASVGTQIHWEATSLHDLRCRSNQPAASARLDISLHQAGVEMPCTFRSNERSPVLNGTDGSCGNGSSRSK